MTCTTPSKLLIEILLQKSGWFRSLSCEWTFKLKSADQPSESNLLLLISHFTVRGRLSCIVISVFKVLSLYVWLYVCMHVWSIMRNGHYTYCLLILLMSFCDTKSKNRFSFFFLNETQICCFKYWTGVEWEEQGITKALVKTPQSLTPKIAVAVIKCNVFIYHCSNFATGLGWDIQNCKSMQCSLKNMTQQLYFQWQTWTKLKKLSFLKMVNRAGTVLCP